jgi:hypothetical protein
MREPTGATPEPGIPEPAAARPASGAISTDETPAGDAVARMEQVIDAFIWDDRDERPEAYAFMPSSAAHANAGDGLTDIVARLAPRSLAGSERLPRIVTSSLPVKPPGVEHDDRWRRQFLDALNEADDDTPMAPAIPQPSAFEREPPSAKSRPHRMAHEQGGPPLATVGDPSRFAAGWRTGRRVLVAAVAMTCVFSTGVLWATHRSEIVAETSGPVETAAAIPGPAAVGDAMPGQSIRNTPVLIREGESVLLTSILPRPINDGERTDAVPVAPIAPVVRVVPVMPIAAAPQMDGAVTPGGANADAVALPAHSQPAGPKVDREGLAALAARSAPPIAIHDGPIHHGPTPPKHRVATVSTGQVSSVPFSAKGPVPEVDRSQVPAGWVQRRQSLRVEPVEEPSTFKKLIGLVWPPGNSSTTAEPPKPAAAPAVTAPAVTAPAYSWSDSARASP